MDQKGSFLSELFDISFKGFITPRIIKYFFILISGLIGLMVLMTGIGMMGYSGVIIMILLPVLFILEVVYARVFLEVTLILFRILVAR